MENKALESLANIKREAGIPYFSSLYDIDEWNEDFSTVEQALKEKANQDDYIYCLQDSILTLETTLKRYRDLHKVLQEKKDLYEKLYQHYDYNGNERGFEECRIVLKVLKDILKESGNL